MLLVFLKQFSKYARSKSEPLLHALALGQLEKYVAAKELLDCHKLTTWLAVVRVFPGGTGRQRWVTEQSHAILAGAAVYRKSLQGDNSPNKSSPKSGTSRPVNTPPR